VEVIGDGGVVDLADAAFLRAHAAGEIAEVVGGEGNVGVERFADRLAVIHCFGIGQQLEVGVDAVGDLQQQVGALARRGLTPGVFRSVGGIERQLDVGGVRAGGFGVNLAIDRGDDVEVLPLDRGRPLAADEVVVLGFVLHFGAGGAGGCVNHVSLLV